MQLKRTEKPQTDYVFFASEGFVPADVVTTIQDTSVNLIQVRYLADGPFFQMCPQHSKPPCHK